MSRRASSARWLGTSTRNGATGLRVALTALVSASLLLAGVAPANAVGPAVLSIEITAIDPLTLEPVTVTGFNQHNNKLAYRVGYACSVADCTDAVVKLPMTNLDPNYNQFRLLDYENWTPPAGTSATIANVPATGATVRLGTIPAGTAATFVVQYMRQIDASAPNVVAASYFPDGYQIQQSATISSPNAVADVTGAAAPVTWQSGVPTPAISKSGPANIRPDTDMTYTLGMSDGCMFHRGAGRWTSSGAVVCARNYTVVDQLPEQAVFVSATDGGTYDSATHTVTWTESGAGAAGGWGSSAIGGWTQWQPWGYNNRSVVVRYPADAFPESANGADFIAPVTNNASVSVTYLDDASTVKTASTSFKHDVVRVEPFGRADHSKIGTSDQNVSTTRFVNVPPNTTGLVCGANNRDDWGRVCVAGQPVAPFTTQTGHYWIVSTANQANVPGIATVVDNDLGNSDVRVRRITTSGGTGAPTIAWTISNGTQTTSGTTTAASYTAPAGSWLTAATITSGTLAGPNLLKTGTASTVFTVNFGYDVPVGSPLFTWQNNASATMTYPDQPQITPIAMTSTAAITFRDMPKVVVPVTPPSFNAGFVGAPVVEGGGNVVPGGKVTFGVRGSTANIPNGRNVSPQYAFIAPAGWTIFPNSASFPAGSVPAGVSYVYKNVTIAGVSRQAVIASWPTGATFGSNATWPTMSVSASPTATVPAGTNSVATFWASDSRNSYDPSATTWGGKTIDTTDVDGDGNVTEAFATVTSTIAVSGTQRLDVIKEICVEKDGTCTWISNPDVIVGAAPNATDIKYRVTLVNSANTTLSGVIGYDVLPFVGDGRTSTFAETLNSITSSTSNLTLSYSSSTNPCRAEVRPTNPGCDSDWTAAVAGAQSIRAVVNGSLAPGATARFEFTANVVPGAGANAVACNSVAVDSSATLPSEPRAVCVTTQEADLAISVPQRLPLQGGRPGTVPFTVTNLGGSPSAPATVKIDVPAGIRVTSLTPSGWMCTSSDTKPDGSVLGPISLTCDAVTATGTSRSLALGVPDALDLPAVVPDASLVGDDACFPAKVSGLMFDPQLANNDASACFSVVASDSLISLTKDDGVTQVGIGAELTYTLNVSNQLVGEPLGAVTITDQLPANVTFVSASNGGVVSAQGAADATGALPGGTVTWTLASLAAAGVPGDGTDGATGAPGSSASVTVTVRVLQSAETLTQIVNTANVSAVDPVNPDARLTDSADDSDATVRVPGISVLKTVDAVTYAEVGQELSYGFSVLNTGNVTLSGVSIIEGTFTGSGSLSDVTCPATALAPGAAFDCTATYTVTLADLDRGTVSNTARATGTPVAGLSAPVSTPSTVVVVAAQQPALTLVKSVTPTTAEQAGDEVTYSFLVTNTGNVTVTDVQITETAFTGDSDNLSDIVCPAAAASLAPTASVTCDATYELTQADANRGSVTNSATATAGAPGDLADPVSEPSTAVVTIPVAAALTLTKSVTGSAATEVGDTVNYSFLVTNTGNVTVTNVGISETDFTGTGTAVAIDCPTTSLAPAGELTCTGTYELTQADVDAGGVDNTAIATAVAPDDSPVESAPSNATVSIDPDAELTLVKSVSTGDFGVGDEVTYSFAVSNTGNVTVSGIAIDETQFTGTGSLSDILCESTSLAAGADTRCEATYTITQADVDAGTVDNTAIATGLSAGEAPVSSEGSTVELPLNQDAALTVAKTADVETYSAVGDVISYQFRVTNTGNVTLSAAAVTETEFTGSGSLDAVECTPTALAPDEFVDCTVDYEIQQGDLDRGSVSNTATATATPPVGLDAPTSAPSTAVVTATQLPALTLAKSVAPTMVVAAGDEVTYSFLVTNSGNVTVTDVEITETAFDGEPRNLSDIVCPADSVAPSSSVTCTATYGLVLADADRGSVTNTATATADAPGDIANPVSEASTAVVTVPATPALNLEKSIDSTIATTAGSTLTYLFAVTNTGNVTVSDIGIHETSFTGTGAPVAIECPATSLAPRDELTCVGTYVLTQSDVDTGRLDNTAIAYGTATGGAPIESGPSTVEFDIKPNGALALVKSVGLGALEVGAQINYSFVVTNIGNVTVTDVAIEETTFTGSGDLSDIVCDTVNLAPAAQAVCSASYTITQADVDAGTIDNTAVATGVVPSGDVLAPTKDVASNGSTARLPFTLAPALTVEKTADVAGYSAVGDVIGYRFRVANIGNTTLSGVEVVEGKFTGTGALGPVECSLVTLLPGQIAECAADYSVTQADIDAGELTNTAHAQASSAFEGAVTVSNDSSVTVAFDGETGLVLTKTGTAVDLDANRVTNPGDQIAWTFTATNTGVTTLTGLAIEDPTAGAVACAATVLPPGATITCEASLHKITAADAVAGRVVNVATASAVGVGGVVVVSDKATASVEVKALPLAMTGLTSHNAVSAALLLLLLGAATVWFARQRRRTHP